jgi:uncharacterized protein (TIGR00290 family)
MENKINAKPKAIFCWSGGKDSAFCLYKVLSEKRFDVVYLLTILNADHKRVSMHGVRESLLDAQSEAIGIPLLKMYVSEGTNSEYEQKMESLLLQAQSEGIDQVIFGDIFLEDLRSYREQNLERIGMKAVFPLWKQDTRTLIRDFLKAGFLTITCCVQEAYRDKCPVGKIIDEDFIARLPDGLDPCGENGEFHTFCFDGPLFKSPVKFTPGALIYKSFEMPNTGNSDSPEPEEKYGFWYCDLI